MGRDNADERSVALAHIDNRILLIRDRKVLLDADLAALYGVQTRVLNQAVKRNRERFPADFMFRLSAKEFSIWRSQSVISNSAAKMALRRPPFAFTEHGALMAATVLNSPRAIQASLYVVRAFIRLRDFDIARTLVEHGKKLAGHDAAIIELMDAVRRHMAAPAEGKRRPIGFVTPSAAGTD
ncbi:MAG: ORF6N domain-containing protein [Betaproteobacteria bacterium]|nr:MAG: ORF6N domain-containing protein [Betaproteobacteria bacterium]